MPQWYTPTETPPPGEWVAPPVGQAAVLGGFEGLASVGENYAQLKTKQVFDEKKAELAKALLAGLVGEGVKVATAKAAVAEWSALGTMTLLDKVKDIQTTAAEIRAKEAGATKNLSEANKTDIEAGQVVPRAEADIAKTNAEAAAVGVTAGAAATTAGARAREVANKHDEFAQTFGLETQKFVSTFDTDKSGTISPDEKQKLLRTNRAAVRKQIQKAKLDEYSADPEVARFRAMTDAEMDAEAMQRTEDEISDYEFAAQGVSRLGQRKPRTTTDLDTSWMNPGTPAPDTVTADRSRAVPDSQTQAAIADLKKLPMNPGVTPDQVRAAIKFRYPTVDVEAVAKALGF